MPDWIADLRVLDQLWLTRGARGEVDKHRIVNGGACAERSRRVDVVGVRVAVPTLDRSADDDAGVVTGDVVEFGGVHVVGDDEPGAAARDAIGQVGRAPR